MAIQRNSRGGGQRSRSEKSGNTKFSAGKNSQAKKRSAKKFSSGGKFNSSKTRPGKVEEARSTFGRPSTSKQGSGKQGSGKSGNTKSAGKFGDKKFGDKRYSDKKSDDKKASSKSYVRFEEKRKRDLNAELRHKGKRKSDHQRSSGTWSREFQPKDNRNALGGKKGFVPYKDFTDKIKFDRRIFDDEPDAELYDPGYDANEYYDGNEALTEEVVPAVSELIRLNKFISNAGVTARRKADELIFTGRVTVNMKTVTEPGTKVNPEKDVVKVDGEKIKPQSEYIYVVLFKPRGYVTTTSDDKGRPTVMDLIGLNTRLYPIGRLDYDTDGVLLLTNDGEFSNMMMHPRHKVFKTYFAKLDKPIEDHDLRKLKEGVVIDGRPTSRAKVRIIPNSGDQNIWISIHEGRNRQVRRMLEALGYIVQRLKRVEYARIGLGELKPGDWRYMTPEEIDDARKLSTPKPVQIKKNPEPQDGEESNSKPAGKTTGKKGGKKKKKLKKLEKMQQKMAVKQQEASTGSDVMDSISKELEDITEQIADTNDVSE